MLNPPPGADVMMGSAGRGFRGRGGGGGGFRGGRGGIGGGFGGRFGGRGSRPEPTGPRDPRSLVSYVDVDAPKVCCSLMFGVCSVGRRGSVCNAYSNVSDKR